MSEGPTALFPMAVDGENAEYLREIAAEMATRFDLAWDDAVSRINVHWARETFGPGLDEDLGHEMPEFWAKTIYYGPNVAWWTFDPQDSYGDPDPS